MNTEEESRHLKLFLKKGKGGLQEVSTTTLTCLYAARVLSGFMRGSIEIHLASGLPVNTVKID